MTLVELRDLLVGQLQIFAPPAIPLLELSPYVEQISGKLLRIHSDSDSIHSAIEAFSKTGKWPDLDDVERTMLVHRLNYAISVLDILTGGWQFLPRFTFPALNLSREDSVRWALGFMWNEGGFPLLEELSRELHSDNGFTPPHGDEELDT